jgi:hypothetical protein
MNNISENDLRYFLKDGLNEFRNQYKQAPKFMPDGAYQGVRQLVVVKLHYKVLLCVT